MVLNYDNTALQLLEKSECVNLGLVNSKPGSLQASEFFKLKFPSMRDAFKKKIHFISNPAYRQYDLHKQNFLTSLLATDQSFNLSGTLIYHTGITIFYDFKAVVAGGELSESGTFYSLFSRAEYKMPVLLSIRHIRLLETMQYDASEKTGNPLLDNQYIEAVYYILYLQKSLPPVQVLHPKEMAVNNTLGLQNATDYIIDLVKATP